MISDWRAHAAQSKLAKLVSALRPNELDDWLDAATPRLPETIRLNPRRADKDWTLQCLLKMGAKPIEWYTGEGGAFSLPWEKGRCQDEEYKIRIQKLHASGRITLQEAASMLPVQVLNVQPGHRVLDLCAAPGSKSTQIAESLQGEGLLIASDPNSGRVNNLVSNIHRTGHVNVVVAQHDGRHFPRVAEPGFDRVLVDAPCTGTGTTRKNTDVWTKWTPNAGQSMHKLQADILRRGGMLLRPGGIMVYSTCSIDPLENEAVVANVLRKCPWLDLVEVNTAEVFPSLKTRRGLTEWPILNHDAEIMNNTDTLEQVHEDFKPPSDENLRHSLSRCIRVWNDENNGSGFFLAIFSQNEDNETNARSTRPGLRDIGHVPKSIAPPPLSENELRAVELQEQEVLLNEWGVDLEGLALWKRGQFVHVSSREILEWMWASKRTTAKHREYPGKHWHPVRVTQAGQPAWKFRKQKNRLLSKGLQGLVQRVTKHRHRVSIPLIQRLLAGEEPGKSTLLEEIPTLANERDGGILLDVEIAGTIESYPAWVAGKLSLMMPEAEKFVLSWRLSEES